MKPDDPEWLELRWWDYALIVALAAALVMAGWAQRYAPESADDRPPECRDGAGPCGCVPVVGNCTGNCTGCCPGGCKPPPLPTHSCEH